MSASPDQTLVTHPLYVAKQAALVGAGSAVPGFLVGATYGTLRTQTPVLFALFSGAQWFAIGGTFYGIRTSLLHSTGLQNWWNTTRGAPLLPNTLPPSHSDRIRASTIAGAFTGFSLGFIFRGPRNVIPGTIVFSLFGFGGQHAYDWLDGRNSDAVREKRKMQEKGEEEETFMQRLAKSRWSPMKALSDEEYQRLMDEKLLRVETEIAIVDEKIEELRKKQRGELEAQKNAEGQNQSQQKR
ncbi:hypothetical protein N0V90_010811 [Kalmusia sp. IMI 367209]|nr:hypothetical protein N0V90_010811 [Kalmusia sp. IMI 367209]